MTKKLLSTREAAEYLASRGIPFTRGTLQVWRSMGRGPRYRKLCSRVGYRPEDLDTFAAGEPVETIDSRKGR
jgi:hypothetical protein